jgi:hypothetical protein
MLCQIVNGMLFMPLDDATKLAPEQIKLLVFNFLYSIRICIGNFY